MNSQAPPTRVRAVVVADAGWTRRLVTQVLGRDGGFDVVDAAAEGGSDAASLVTSAPDLVLIDVEWLEREGMSVVREIRRVRAGLPVFVLSPASERSARTTLDALAAGATDHVTLPPVTLPQPEAAERLAVDMIPRIRAHMRPEARPAVEPAPVATARAFPRPVRRASVRFVCIAASTGGPHALAELFAGFVQPLPVPVAIVQHMPPTFTAMLADRLNASTGAARCREACAGDAFVPGVALLAPGGRHLGVARAPDGHLVARLNEGPPVNACRPAADVLFAEAAEVVGAGVLGVVMTGMGHDGRRGAELIREAGGQVIVQDEASSVVWGMPGTVVRAGLADAVLPLSRLAADISRRVVARPGA